MPQDNQELFGINQLINNAFQVHTGTLRELFDQKLRALDLAPTAVLPIIGISNYRTLNGILDGTQKMVDFTNVLKIATFLQQPNELIIKLYLEALERSFPGTITAPPNIKFLKENFDLAALKKAGFIDNISDFDAIEKKLVTFLGLRKIEDYRKPEMNVAFSAGLVKPKNELNRALWIYTAKLTFEDIGNPYEYSRQALVEYFPNIRFNSIDVELGLISVIKDLYKLGVTVIYQPPLPTLQLRGATFAVDDKPCIVLTNYVGFYPTLWFALVHELFHVLFDWEEIRSNTYHLSDDENNELVVKNKEREADNFAREYLFSADKINYIKAHLHNEVFVKDYALRNHVHHSFPYVFAAFAKGNDTIAWSRARKQSPDVNKAIYKLNNSWAAARPIADNVKKIQAELYN